MTARFATLQEWLQWQETLHPSVIDLGLGRIRQVAEKLFGHDFVERQPLTITVAGTNGKGSCVTALSVLLRALGQRVGSFTSPHLFRYNERIRIDTNEVSDADLCTAFAAIDAARADTSLTYFEFNALAALWLFRHHQVDVQVLEVGLGGRLDAANLLDADLAVITNIALDHTDWLGDTREQIGAEKAGILRENGKLVYGEADMPDSIRRHADNLGVAIRQCDRDFSATVHDGHFNWYGLDAAGQPLQLTCVAPALPLPSVACALQVLAWLDHWDANAFIGLLPAIRLRGRLQQLSWREREWILDVAHNEAGARFLAGRLQQTGDMPLTAVLSAMADKDLAGIFTALAPQVRQWVLFPLADNPRAASLAQLREAALAAGVAAANIIACDALQPAVEAAIATGDRILVCGSFFTVSAVGALLQADGCGNG